MEFGGKGSKSFHFSLENFVFLFVYIIHTRHLNGQDIVLNP